MKFFVFFATVTVCLTVAGAGRPSTKYLPPNYAAVGAAAAAGSSQYPHYHGVSGGAAQAIPAATSPVHTSAQYGHNRAAAQIPILRSDYSNDGSGNYNFGFETGNGIKRNEAGHFQGSWPGGSLNVAGSYSYTGDDGKLYSVSYKADSNGFHAEGDHLPTPPPIPREIQETLHLHQHGARQQASTGHYTVPSDLGNFAAASYQSGANIQAPNSNYLPPQGYNYNRQH